MKIELLYNGASQEELGLSDLHYAMMQEKLAAFLADWDRIGNFRQKFIEWDRRTLPQMPAMPLRIGNLSTALFRFVVEGMPTETKEEATRRLEVCETNECGYFDGSVCRHTACGCFSKIKTFFSTEHCPIGKW